MQIRQSWKMNPIQGLHHITAVASNAQQNLDFYENVLGQRLVKRTVNFDDPGTYHLYYGDDIGTPGTILTFFPWAHVVPGRPGHGEATAVGYRIPASALGYWKDRLADLGFETQEEAARFGEAVIQFNDPDGMAIELIASDVEGSVAHWEEGPVPAEAALQGFHSVTLWLKSVEATANLLVNELGYTKVGEEGNRSRFKAAGIGSGLYIDLLHTPDVGPGRFGAGSIHHIAFRTVDDTEQAEYSALLTRAGQQVTPVKDRQYFHSIYFRSPGGVLFEVATDAPGFLYDEPREELGNSLKLPEWLEENRDRIETLVPALERAPVEK